MVTALSGRGLLAGSAVLVLCLGGVVVAATVGASPAPGPEIGPPVVVGATIPALPDGSSRSPSEHTTGEPSPWSRDHDDDDDGHEAEVVGPPPIREVEDEESEEPKTETGTATTGKTSGG